MIDIHKKLKQEHSKFKNYKVYEIMKMIYEKVYIEIIKFN